MEQKKETKQQTLADYLDVNVSFVKDLGDNYYGVGYPKDHSSYEEYLILDNKQDILKYAKEWVIELVKENGLYGAFQKPFYNWIISYALNDDYIKSAYKKYLENVLNRLKGSSLVKFLYNQGYLTADDFDGRINDPSNLTVDVNEVKQQYINDSMDAFDSVDYDVAFDNIGVSFDDFINSESVENVVDFDAVVKKIISYYGIGYFLANEDDKEIQLDVDKTGKAKYYAYRTN